MHVPVGWFPTSHVRSQRLADKVHGWGFNPKGCSPHLVLCSTNWSVVSGGQWGGLLPPDSNQNADIGAHAAYHFPYGPILHILKGYRRNIPLYHFLLLVITDEVWSAWGATRQGQVSLCCTLQRSFLPPPALAQWDRGTALCFFAGLCLRGKKDWKFLGMLSLSASCHWTDGYRRQLRLTSVLIWLQAFKSKSPTYEDTALKNLGPALRRTFAVLSPAMVASCCAVAYPRWSCTCMHPWAPAQQGN